MRSLEEDVWSVKMQGARVVVVGHGTTPDCVTSTTRACVYVSAERERERARARVKGSGCIAHLS